MSLGETECIHRWVDRLQAGDQEALNELIAHFERRLRALTRRMIKDYPLVHCCEQTDDVFQKAVLRLCRALKTVTPATSRDLIRLSATQVRRELLNLARFYRARLELLPQQCERFVPAMSARTHGRIQGVELRDLPGWDASDSPLMDQWGAFHEAAAALADPGREVFDLIWYQGMTFDEVSQVQQVSTRTVRNRWNTARLAIHDALEGNLPGT